MKQRLLLALLALFVSVGMVKAADETVTLKINPNAADVKVSYTGTAPTLSTSLAAVGNTFTIKNSASIQEITITLDPATTGLTFTGNMAELEVVKADNLTALNFGSNSTLGKLTLTSANGLTKLSCNNLGLTTLTLSGADKLTNLDCSNNQLAALVLTNVSATTVNCSNNLLVSITPRTASNFKYTSFNCSGNKLKNVVADLAMSGSAKADYGYQTIAIASTNPETFEATANQLYNIADRAIGTNATLKDIITTTTDYTWGGQWQKKGADGKYTTNSDAHADNTYKTQFTFYNSNKYQSGEYLFSVVPDATVANPIKYWVALTVKPAAVNIILQQPDKIDGNRGGTITVSEVGSSSTKATTDISEADGETLAATQGKQYSFLATPVEGFTFKKFDISSNTDGFSLKSSDESASMATYELVGLTKYPKELKVKPVFEAKSYTVNYKGDQKNGTYTIRVKDGAAFENGKGTATYGQTIVINAQPNAGYKAMVTIGQEKQEELTAPKEYVITSDLNIAVTFVTEGTDIKISADRPKSVFAAVTLNETTIDGIDGGSGGTWQTKADPNTTAVLKLTLSDASSKTTAVTNILFNGQELTITRGVKDDGKKTFTVSFDVPAEGGEYSLVIKTVEQTATSIVPDASKNTAFVYDGTGKTLLYTTTPANLDNVKVVYSVNTVTDQGAAESYSGPWTEKAPVNAGSYAAKASRDADNVYQEAEFNSTNSKKPVLITIAPATVAIKTLPTVSIKNTNGLLTYSFSGGEAVLGTTKVTGTFEVVNDGTNNIDDEQVVKKSAAHTAKIAFFAKTSTGALDPNYVTDRATAPSAQVAVKGTDGKSVDNYAIKMNVPEGSGITVTLKNGENTLNATPSATASATVPAGTVLTFVINNPNGWKITQLTEIADGNPEVTAGIPSGGSTANSQSYTMNAGGVEHAMNILVNAEAVADNSKDYTVTLEDYTIAYKDGKAIEFGAEGLAKIKVKENAGAVKTVISYKNSKGETIALPVNADTYTVRVKIVGATVSSTPSYDGDYKDKYVDAKMIVTPRELEVGDDKDLVFPTIANPVGLGQKLQQATFADGKTRVAGSFAWETPTVEAKNGTSYQVIFKPTDTNNYTILNKGPKISVTVSNKQLVTYGNPENGKIVVKDDKGGIYLSGDEVKTGTKLIIQSATNDLFTLNTLIVNDQTVTVSGDSYTYTVPKDKSVAIEATFKVKSAVDPNTQYTVTLPAVDAVKGVVIGKPGVNAVAKGGSFAFTLSMLAADSANVVVTVDGAVLEAVNGTFTINPVDANKTVTVALATPTKIKVSVPREVKNAGGYVMGKVEVEGLAADSTCYYGDEVTIVAFPESGVVFGGWSGAITSKEKLATFTVTEAMKIAPVFSGVPTGIEDLKATTTIRGEQGSIFFSCNGEAKVIIISMDGRTKVVEVSGETRIPMSTGVYGVVLEQSSQVIKQKVIVR